MFEQKKPKKKATGGKRDREIDKATIICGEYDKDVAICIVLDDITTSGESLYAAYEIIHEKYPNWEIKLIAIGKTQ